MNATTQTPVINPKLLCVCRTGAGDVDNDDDDDERRDVARFAVFIFPARTNQLAHTHRTGFFTQLNNVNYDL